MVGCRGARPGVVLRVRSGGGRAAGPDALALWHNRRFRMFAYAVAGAYTGILIRCIYR